MITDKERLDFVERNPEAIGLKPKWRAEFMEGELSRVQSWIDIRQMIDTAIIAGSKPKTIFESAIT